MLRSCPGSDYAHQAFHFFDDAPGHGRQLVFGRSAGLSDREMRLAQGISQRDFNSRLRFRDSRLVLNLTRLRNNQLLLPEQFWRTKRNLGLPGKQCAQVVVLFLWPRLALKSRHRPIPLDGSFSDGLPGGNCATKQIYLSGFREHQCYR